VNELIIAMGGESDREWAERLYKMCNDQADEIERLRADNQELRQIIRRAFGEMQKVGPQLMPVRDGTVDYLHE
jgi:trans-2-enoyl-CoA reductase